VRLPSKYDLIYRRGDMIQLVHRYILQWTRFGGDKVKTIRKWHPSINMVCCRVSSFLAKLWGGEAGKGRPLGTWPKLAAFIHPPPSLQNTTGDGVCVCSRARVFELLLGISLNEGFQKVPFFCSQLMHNTFVCRREIFLVGTTRHCGFKWTLF